MPGKIDPLEYPPALRGFAVVSYDRSGRDLIESAAEKKASDNGQAPPPPKKERSVFERYLAKRPPAPLVVGNIQQLTESPYPDTAAPAQTDWQPSPEFTQMPPTQDSSLKKKASELETSRTVLRRVQAELPEEGAVVVTSAVGDFFYYPERFHVEQDFIVLMFSSVKDISFTPKKGMMLYGTVVSESYITLYGLYYSGIKFPALSDNDKVVMIFHRTDLCEVRDLEDHLLETIEDAVTTAEEYEIEE